jgi:predicted alpha/beta-hydrolase family hydrolase
MRVEHFPKLSVPALFVSGTRDPFGSIEEIRQALRLIPAKTELMVAEGVGHDLGFSGKAKAVQLPSNVLEKFVGFFGSS